VPEDRGGGGARARELPAGPGGGGEVHVDEHHRPGLHNIAVPFPCLPGRDPQHPPLHVDAAVRHERPQHAHDAAGRPPPVPRRVAVVGERREGGGAAGGEGARGKGRDRQRGLRSAPGGEGEDRAEVAG
jgi:hypothetical protein